MTRHRLLRSVLLVGLFASAAAGAASPDVTLPDVHGKPHHFSDFIGRGQWTVLTVWGPRCPPCIEEMPELQKFHDANKDGRARVLGVAVDFPSFGPARRDEVAQFSENYLISFPLLLGSEDAFTRFGGTDLMGVPTTVIYDPNGAIVARHMGSVSRDMLERFINKWDKVETSK